MFHNNKDSNADATIKVNRLTVYISYMLINSVSYRHLYLRSKHAIKIKSNIIQLEALVLINQKSHHWRFFFKVYFQFL